MSEQATPLIRPFEKSDWPQLWPLLAAVFHAGETYAFPVDINEQQAYQAWIQSPQKTFVAVEAETGALLGSYYIKPNHPGPGAHVCNCGYLVAETARGRGLAGQMCVHSQREAVSLGFLAMQYNLVVATNEQAIRIWKRQGFEVVGRLPKAFRHATKGLVDALVMYKTL